MSAPLDSPLPEPRTCPSCRGEKVIRFVSSSEGRMIYDQMLCSRCGGTGRIAEEEPCER